MFNSSINLPLQKLSRRNVTLSTLQQYAKNELRINSVRYVREHSRHYMTAEPHDNKFASNLIIYYRNNTKRHVVTYPTITNLIEYSPTFDNYTAFHSEKCKIVNKQIVN